LIAVFNYLLENGMNQATEVIYTGGSAGGFTVFNSIDLIASMMPPGAKLVGSADAGFFLDLPLWNNPGKYNFRDEFIAADAFWNSTGAKSLNAGCMAAYPSNEYMCFFSFFSSPYIKTPWNVVMSAYDLATVSLIIGLTCVPNCTGNELVALQYLRSEYLGGLTIGLESYPGNGAFICSCLVHEIMVDYCRTQPLPNCLGWNLYNVSAPGFPPNLTPQQGFSLWYTTTMARWSEIKEERELWDLKVKVSILAGTPYPKHTPEELESLKATQVAILDPTVWPNNPSCPYPLK
jgi:hypothetical protein